MIFNHCGDENIAKLSGAVLFSGHFILQERAYDNFLYNCDRIPSTTPGAEPPRDARDSGSARSHSTHLETSSSDRPKMVT